MTVESLATFVWPVVQNLSVEFIASFNLIFVILSSTFFLYFLSSFLILGTCFSMYSFNEFVFDILLIYDLKSFFWSPFRWEYFWLNFSSKTRYVSVLKSSSSGNFMPVVSESLIVSLLVIFSIKLKYDSVFSSGDKFSCCSNNLYIEA